MVQDRWGLGIFSKLPDTADDTGAGHRSTPRVARCHFLPQARNKMVFSKSVDGTVLSFSLRLLVWLAAAQVKPTSFWPPRVPGVRADPCMFPTKAKSAGQSALSPPQLLLQPPCPGELLHRKWVTPPEQGQCATYSDLLSPTQRDPATRKTDQFCP